MTIAGYALSMSNTMTTTTVKLKMMKTGAVRTFRNLGEMILSFGMPARDVELVRSTSKVRLVYVNGALYGEAVMTVNSASAATAMQKAA